MSFLNWGGWWGACVQSWIVSFGISSAFSFILNLGFSLFHLRRFLSWHLKGQDFLLFSLRYDINHENFHQEDNNRKDFSGSHFQEDTTIEGIVPIKLSMERRYRSADHQYYISIYDIIFYYIYIYELSLIRYHFYQRMISAIIVCLNSYHIISIIKDGHIRT